MTCVLAAGELVVEMAVPTIEDSVFPIRHFYQRWGTAIAIERRPSVAARLHAAERALADPDPAVRDQAVREAAEIVQAAYREVAGAGLALGTRHR